MTKINKKEFLALLANREHYRKLKQKTSRPFPTSPEPKDLRAYVEALYAKIVDGHYMPAPPRAYNLIEKADGTARIVPLLSLDDLLVYRFCVMSLEAKIATNRVENTFGGWSMGGLVRKVEDLETAEVSDQINIEFELWRDAMNQDIEYAGFATTDPEQWSKNWQQYQTLAYVASRDYPDGAFLQLALANFFGSIRLDSLEDRLRSACDREHQPVIDLLFVFLRFWNRTHEGYSPKSVGIPQDESGDSSRLLANFFLQEYDLFMHNRAQNINARYLRYSDDQMVVGPNADELRSLLYEASVYLRTTGLSLNGSKIKCEDSRRFQLRWAFELHKDFDVNPQYVAEQVVDICEDPTIGDNWRWEGLVKRLIKHGFDSFPHEIRTQIFKLIQRPSFLGQLNGYHFIQLRKHLSNEEWQELVSSLIFYLRSTLSNQTHLILLKFLDQIGENRLREEIEELAATRSVNYHMSSFKDDFPQ